MAWNIRTIAFTINIYNGKEDIFSRYNDAAISRHHAMVWVAQGGLWLTDDNSANGLFNAVSTEVYGTQTAEFSALITEIARQTEQAPTPQATDTPLPTATFTPLLVETLFHPGDVHAVSGSVRLQKGRLYRICLSGTTNLTTGPVKPSDIEFVNGIKVPLSGCLVLEGGGSAATISCSGGEPAEDPGGFTIQIFDLGPY